MSDKNKPVLNAEMFSTLQTFRKPMTQVDVEIKPSELFGDATKYTLLSANRIFRDSQNAPIVDSAILTKYFIDALVHRVQVARGNKINLVLKQRQRFYPLPAVVYNAIRQIGEAKDTTYNVKFLPMLSEEIVQLYGSNIMTKENSEADAESALDNAQSKDAESISRNLLTEKVLVGKENKMMSYSPLSDDDFDAVVNMMRGMEEEGYTVSEALCRDVYGDINVMAMTNVENETNGPQSLHGQSPVYAFYRAFFYNKRLEHLVDAVFTYRYNTMSEMSGLLKDLTMNRRTMQTASEVESEFR